MNVEYKTLSLCTSTELVLCTDGTYTLRHTDVSEKCSDTSAFYLIQCYSNGCINKISVDNLIALRYDYKYSHGIYPLATLLASSIVSTNDSICVKYTRNGIERNISIDVQALRSHSMLGLKGIDIIGTTFDKVIGWYLNGNLISDHSGNMKPIDTNKQTVSENLQSAMSDDISGISNVENKYDLEKEFSEYLKSGRNIPLGQKFAKEVLALCETKEEFWYVIKTLFKCNTHIYRSPVVDYLNEHDITQFMPNTETLFPICEQLFSITAKPEKNLEFLYHFKDILTDEIKEKIVSSTNSFSKPNQYFKLCDMLGMNAKELIEYCIKQSNAASYYCVYEMLLKVREKEGYFAARKLIITHIGELNDTSIKGKLIKRLINFEFNKDKNKPAPEITAIKTGGFNEYIRLCNSHEGKKESQTIQNSIASYVGKKIDGKYVATYSNHYFLMSSNGIRILLPKSMSTNVLRDGDTADIQIAYADKRYNTLYATQKMPIDYNKIIQMPLLNNGDVIEISFDLHIGTVPHKCYKKIKVDLESYPKEIDKKARYKAKVIRQTTDKYHYLVKIISNDINTTV